MFKHNEFPKHTLLSNNSFLYFVNLSTECFPLAFTVISNFNLKYEQNQTLKSTSPLATLTLMCVAYITAMSHENRLYVPPPVLSTLSP